MKTYWNYLNDHGKGISSTKVSCIKQKGREVYLHLSGLLSPAGLDSIQLQIYADRYPANLIKPIAHRSDDGVLTLRPHKDILRILPTGSCEKIFIISVFFFLVARVGADTS